MRSLQTETMLAGCVTGLFFHLVYNRFEPNIKVFGLNVIALTGLASFMSHSTGSLVTAIASAALFMSVHLASLSFSITLYRLIFHPLRKFPGPWTAKLTKWTDVYHTNSGYRHVWLSSLHAEYGEIVRIGPNELSFSSPGAVKYLHGPQGARLRRGPYYDVRIWGSGDAQSMAGTRDWEDHRVRRRIWDHGFSQKALKTYEPRILALLDKLCEGIAASGGKVDFSLWSDYFSFDTMGDLAFNEPFGLLSPDGPRFYSSFVRKGMQIFSTMSSVPWASPILPLLPIPNAVKTQARQFSTLGKNMYIKRRKQGTEPNDLFSHLLKGDKDGKTMREVDLQADSPVIIIAGSDTSSITMTFLFYLLTRNPDAYSLLRDEIDTICDSTIALSGSMLRPETCPYLNGAINEALRIWPPGPNGMQRQTGPNGHIVDGTFIPKFTQVHSNTLSLHRNPRNFTKPMQFVPERWNDKFRDPSWNHDVRAFIPFTGGTFSCAGRALALLELRMFTVKLMKRFDFQLVEGFNWEEFERSVKSYQSLIKGPLVLNVTNRV